METLVLPNIPSDFKRERAVDEMPQSAAGKTIMTTEPKFIPEEAVVIELEQNVRLNVRLIDCVGYIVPSSLGYIDNEMPRMVVTPWFEQEVPFTVIEKCACLLHGQLFVIEGRPCIAEIFVGKPLGSLPVLAHLLVLGEEVTHFRASEEVVDLPYV